MPKYRFVCQNCKADIERFASIKTEEAPCSACSGIMKRQLPNIGSQVVHEVVDKFTNVKHTANQKAEDAQRKQDYFWDIQVPRLVQEYSVQTCLEEGWLVYNDKGELVINKPPSKR